MKRKPIEVLDGRARLYAPTESHRLWRVKYRDPITLKWKAASGGPTQENAELVAAAKLGQYVPGYSKDPTLVPTLEEVFNSWVNDNRYRWSSRTVDAYEYLARRFLSTLGKNRIETITPTQLRTVDVSDLSRGQQEKVRTLIRGTFAHAQDWVRAKPENYASAIRVTGTRASARVENVRRGDIARIGYIASVIVAAHHTAQIGPLDPDDMIEVGPGDDPEVELDPNDIEQDPDFRRRLPALDLLTGVKRNLPVGNRELTVIPPDHSTFTRGLPDEMVREMRRGMPKHYTNREQRAVTETRELAGRFRQTALITALGAGGGLRIGEILALRVRHFMDRTMAHRLFDLRLDELASSEDRAKHGIVYRGRVEIKEQASQASKGKIWLTPPKGGRERITHLPAFLPSWHWRGEVDRGFQRAGIAAVLPRFTNPAVSLWDATEDEAKTLWRAGYTPLGWMLWNRLKELHAAVPPGDSDQRLNDFMDLLLFPTRNQARMGGRVEHEPNWPYSVRIVPGQGTYQSQTNYAGFSNPIYDHVSTILNDFPEHRTNSRTRRGWTHHGLRHFAVSSRIASGQPLTDVASEMGHKDAGFTLKRYGHVVGKERPAVGFEF